MLLAFLGGVQYYRFYQSRLVPVLVFSESLETCKNHHLIEDKRLKFMESIYIGKAAQQWWRRGGIPQEKVQYAITVRGAKIIKLVPDRFNFVHCSIITEKDDPDTVHFYIYDPKYKCSFRHGCEPD